jgi:hypothetical protein
MAKRQPKPPLELTGRVFCDWNCYTMLAPKPDVLQAGDLLVWSWSGDSKKPNSKSSKGLLRVSVYNGKERKTLKVKRTAVHHHLRFESDSERERKLSSLLPELRALKSRTLVKATGGFEVAPLPPVPSEPTPLAAAAAPVAVVSAKSKSSGKPVQGTLFDEAS